jgi:beta-glucosidase-like glycosyl hydrolase
VEGNAKGVMCSYNAVNGVPTCANPLLSKVLRETWNFTGYVSSDTGAVQDISDAHHYVSSREEGACAAIRNGRCDLDSGSIYMSSLLAGVKDGHCSMDDVRKALFNTLRLRFQLGLFDNVDDQPYWHVPLNAVNTTQSQVCGWTE